ncbi:unnamed protein product [Anisakis simplex]|uniref:G_PROTEIN_RECEP_F1_2 domain-containing protein n=1 Tax=Anisakis simplex TaxID=6269 RepID=A0A0M3J4Q3_ANISI|nr:unnamed protein product [Anisakis simplex]
MLARRHHTVPDCLAYRILSNTTGQLTILFYYAGIYTNILITINRCFVITWPALYQKYFDKSMTIRWIMIVWSLSFLQSCIYLIQFKRSLCIMALKASGACPISVTEQQQRRKRENRFFVQVIDSKCVLPL